MDPGEETRETTETHGSLPKGSPERGEDNCDSALALQTQEQVHSYDDQNSETAGKELHLSSLSDAICGLEERLAARLTKQIEKGIAQAMLQVKEQEGSERREQREDRVMDTTHERREPLDEERRPSVKTSRSDDGSAAVSVSDTDERDKDHDQIMSKTASGSRASSATEPNEPTTAGEATEKWDMERIIATIERPKLAMPTFSGDCRNEFALFLPRFIGYLARHPVSHEAKLEMLVAACTGLKMKKALTMYTQLDPEEGYKQAMTMLQERLGSTQDHMDEAMYELQHGPSIQDTDKEGLDEFIDTLWDTFIALQLAGRQSDLNNFGIISNLADRLTGKLRERYEDQLLKYKTQNESRPGIKWFRDLLTLYSRKLTQKSIKTKGEDEKKGTRNTSHKAEGGGQGSAAKRKAEEDSKDTAVKRRAMGFASTAGWSPSKRNLSSKKQSPTPCSVCNRNHLLSACWGFRSLSVTERWEATRKAQACFICLGLGHSASECKVTKKECGLDGCQHQHSRWLHRTERQREEEPERKVVLYTPEVKNKPGRPDQEDA